MSLRLVVGENYPRNFWMLDGTSPHRDYSGYNDNATTASTTYGASLVNGASRSLIVSNTQRVTYPARTFVRGTEHLDFSLQASFRVVKSVTPYAPQQVIGNEGSMDGIVVEGPVVSFVTKYATSGEARASYNIGSLKVVHAVGVHTREANYLYVNGELVAEVEKTDAQKADQFLDSGSTLSSGESSGANTLMLNAVGVYELALDDASIQRYYDVAFMGNSAESVANIFGGHLVEFASSATDPLYEIQYSEEEDWLLGGMVSVGVVDGVLRPETENDLTLAGTWQIAIPLDDAGSNVYAGIVQWDGLNVFVHTSMDGTTWTLAENGIKVSTIPSNTSMNNKTIHIRVTFQEGIDPSNAVLNSLTFTLYATSTLPEVAGREIILSNASPEVDAHVKSFDEDWGVELRNGTVTIKQSTSEDAFIPKTIEVWVRKDGSSFVDNLINASPTVWRSNGGAGSSYRTGEWALRHYVFSAGFSGDIVFSGVGQIGHVVMYPDQLTNDDIKKIYDYYMGAEVTVVNSSDAISLFEFPGEVDMYEYDWTIESSG